MFGLFEGRRPLPPEAARQMRSSVPETRAVAPRPKEIEIDTAVDIPLEVEHPEFDLRERHTPNSTPRPPARDISSGVL